MTEWHFPHDVTVGVSTKLLKMCQNMGRQSTKGERYNKGLTWGVTKLKIEGDLRVPAEN